MNVAFLYYYANLGGVTSVIKSRMPALTGSGWTISAHFSNDLGGVRELQQAGVRTVEIIPDLSTKPSVVINRGDIDVLTVFDMPETISTLREQFSRPIILEIHTPIDRVLLKTSAADLDNVDRVLVPSRWSQQWVREKILGDWDRDKVSVVPNIIDRSLFYPAAREPSSSRPPVLVWVGKIAAYKRWRDAVRILGSVRQTLDCSVVFVTGGDSNERNTRDFLTELMSCGLLGRCSWLYNLPSDEMANLYRDCARSGGVVLSTSEAESFCLVAHEAMSCGAPVVSANAGALPEVYPGKLGRLLFEVGEVKHAADIILETVRDWSLWRELSDLGLQEQKKYDPDLLRQHYMSELRGVLRLGKAA